VSQIFIAGNPQKFEAGTDSASNFYLSFDSHVKEGGSLSLCFVSLVGTQSSFDENIIDEHSFERA